MGLFLPQPPAPDSDEEEDPEGAAAHRSRASIPMDAGKTLSFLMLIVAVNSMHIEYKSASLSMKGATMPTMLAG